MGKVKVKIMHKTFEINGKQYKSIVFDMNTLADLDELGVSIEEFSTKFFACMRAYFALCSGMDVRSAGNEIQTHIVEGGSLDELTEAITYEQENSAFFRAIKEKSAESNQQGETEEEEEAPKKPSKTATKAKATGH